MSGWNPLIVNVALTGMVPTKADNPAVPITPDEIDVYVHLLAQFGLAMPGSGTLDRSFKPLLPRGE